MKGSGEGGGEGGGQGGQSAIAVVKTADDERGHVGGRTYRQDHTLAVSNYMTLSVRLPA